MPADKKSPQELKDNWDYVSRLVDLADEDIKAGRVVSHEEVIRQTELLVDRSVANKAKRKPA